MKKAVILMLALVVLLAAFCGCDKRNVDDGETVPEGTTETLPDSTAPEQKKEYSIVGKYVCDSDYCRQIEMRCKPSVNFFDDGTCRMLVNFLGGTANINGKYTVEENKVDVKLDFSRSIFEGTELTYIYMTHMFLR